MQFQTRESTQNCWRRVTVERGGGLCEREASFAAFALDNVLFAVYFRTQSLCVVVAVGLLHFQTLVDCFY
jgi:hypothetical protein